jgi:hypothetical protein
LVSVLSFGVFYQLGKKNINTIITDRSSLFEKVVELQHNTLLGFAMVNAWWDDMVKAVDEKDEAWLADTVLVDIEKFYGNVVWIYNKKGEMIYGATLYEDKATKDIVTKNLIPPEKVREWIANSTQPNFFINTEAGLIEVAGDGISMSTDNPDRNQPFSGMYIAARLWDKDYLSKKAKIL